MTKNHRYAPPLAIVLAFLFVGPSLAQNEVTLEVLQFPERETTKITMTPSLQVGDAEVEAEIRFVEGQTRIEIAYKGLKPAVLFSGDITCYVLWAIGRDGTAENLGELWARPEKDQDKIVFSTGLKVFALIATAESYYTTRTPSSLVVLQSGQRKKNPPLRSDSVTFSNFKESPKVGVDNLRNVKYDGKTPLDIVQAQKVFEIANRVGAGKYSASLFEEAKIGLQQAIRASAGGAKKGAQEYARRSFAASSDAIRTTNSAIQAEELEAQFIKRQAEMEGLEKRSAAAEASAREFETKSKELEAKARELEATAADLTKQQAAKEKALAESQKELEKLAGERTELERQQAALKASMAGLEERNVALQGRLQGALSSIADTRKSAEGFIVNLPDILFELNKSDLKPEAQLVLAKMAGVLLMMQDLTLKIEGHTDSTGTAQRNLELSQQRADAVLKFMTDNSIAANRITAKGMGMDHPIADNSTADGRKKNRRVEILIQ